MFVVEVDEVRQMRDDRQWDFRTACSATRSWLRKTDRTIDRQYVVFL